MCAAVCGGTGVQAVGGREGRWGGSVKVEDLKLLTKQEKEMLKKKRKKKCCWTWERAEAERAEPEESSTITTSTIIFLILTFATSHLQQ